MTRPGSVTAVIPTLAEDRASLARSVESVLSCDLCDVVLVIDRAPGEVEHGVSASPRVDVVWTGGGAGYAMATQTGVGAARGDFVLLLNDDAWFVAGIPEMVEAISADPSIAGAAPKVRLATDPEILNSVGTIIRRDGWADSRGIGQPDLGQYDRSERVFGLHFAAAMVRRGSFDPSAVGPLDTSYVAYYEDIDWCFRAGLLGLRFVSVPGAVAMHEHSATARDRPFAFRFRLQQRNLIRTAIRCFEASRAIDVAARQCAALAWRALKRDPLARGGGRALAEVVAGLGTLVRQRRAIQRRRRVGDEELFSLSAGERSWFDELAGPVIGPGPLLSALRRRSDQPALVALAGELESSVAAGRWEQADEIVSRAPRAAAAYWRRFRPSDV